MSANTFPVIEMEGMPFDMGYQHGTQAKDMIAHCMEMFYRTIADDPWGLLPKVATKLSFEQIVDLGSKSLPYTNRHAPELVEEMRGIAKGSGFTLEEVFALNCDADIWITLFLSTGVGALAHELAHNSCSTYAVGKTATRDGQTYVGWNADTMDWFEKSSVILRGRPTNGLPFSCWNYAGVVGRPGVNPYLGLTANGLWPTDCAPGLPYPVLCRKILEQRTVADAIAVIHGVKRMSGMNYTLGDSEGNIAAVEATATHTAVLPGVNGKVVHTNHIQAEELLPYDAVRAPELSGARLARNSEERLERLTELIIEAEPGSITLDDLKAAHRDHDHRPNSVCCHSDGPTEGPVTLLSMICQPGKSKMLVTRGNPCENEFVEYSL